MVSVAPFCGDSRTVVHTPPPTNKAAEFLSGLPKKVNTLLDRLGAALNAVLKVRAGTSLRVGHLPFRSRDPIFQASFSPGVMT